MVPDLRYSSDGDFQCDPDGRVRRGELIATLLRRGWVYREFQGRAAMERMLCRPCLNTTKMVERDAERVRQKHLELERRSGEKGLMAEYNEEYV